MPSTSGKMQIEIKKIWISPGHDFKGRHGKGRLEHGAAPCASIQCVAGQGIEGDRYFGHQENFKGQITFIAEDIVSSIESKLGLPPFDRSVLRRNVLISGVDLNSLIGKQFRISDVTFSGSEECSPCYWMDEAVGPGAHEALKGNGGLRCRIENSGTLSIGTHELEII